MVSVGDGTVLGEAPGGTPTAMFEVIGDSPVKSRPVDPGLSPRDDCQSWYFVEGSSHSENIWSASTMVISPNLARASMSILEESPTMEISFACG